jgi:hypothetical protein
MENHNEIKETHFHGKFFSKYVVLVIGNGIIRPFVSEHILTAGRYINFYELLEGVQLEIRWNVWF